MAIGRCTFIWVRLDQSVHASRPNFDLVLGRSPVLLHVADPAIGGVLHHLPYYGQATGYAQDKLSTYIGDGEERLT